MNALVEQLRTEVFGELEENILPYWRDNMVDPRGGFYGRRSGDNTLFPDAQKGAILNARILWTFSAAYRILGKSPYLDVATRAKREIIDRFYDAEYGGIYWSLNADGTPADTKKQFYAIGFAIYGLSEYARATGDSEALEYAIRLFYDIERHSRDNEKGGYIEALTRQWAPIADMRLSDKDLNATKTMNTHLHIIEAYTNLLRVWDNPYLREATKTLLHLFLEKIVNRNNRYHLGLFFDDDWNIVDGGIISYGHDIESAWLLQETANVLGEKNIIDKTREMSKNVATAAFEGRCVDGSMIYERIPDGHYDNDKHWWVQAENVVGQWYLYLLNQQTDTLKQVLKSWSYIRKNLIDRQHGEWFWSIQHGIPNIFDDKAGFWKCPYHNARMCLEIIESITLSTKKWQYDI